MSKEKPKILFVAFPFSIHTARWLGQLECLEWDIHLFSSMTGKLPHKNIRQVTFHEQFYHMPTGHPFNFRPLSFPFLSWTRNWGLNKFFRRAIQSTGLEKGRVSQLEELIKRIKPDIIHSFETQHAGYLLRSVKKKWNGRFPFWIHSNWGIDLHYFGVLPEHAGKIRETLKGIDLLIVEGKRDEDLARKLGFNKEIVTIPSVGGGFKAPEIAMIPASARRTILLKGAQDTVRRGLVALRALERCVEVLEGNEVVLYSSNEITREAAAHFFARTGKSVSILDDVSQEEMLQLNASARINITVNMSDGLPNSMLEAMMMGAFPIQSITSVADEWIQHGLTGMLVPPEDPEQIELAIRKSLSDDKMVDDAQVINRAKILTELEYEKVRVQVIHLYKQAIVSHYSD